MAPRPPDLRVGDPALDDWLGEQGEVDWGDERRADPSRRNRGEDPGRRSRDRAGGEDAVDQPTAAAPPSADAHRLAVVRRRRAIALVALFALALIGVGIGVTALRDGDPATSPTTAPAVVTQPPIAPEPPAASTTPETPAESPTLTIELPASGPLGSGDRGEEVETLQTGLAALGHDPGEVDGIFGDATQEAVLAYQRANDLEADGIVGPATVKKLNATLAAEGVTG
jgi:hypothetical protein